MRRTIQREKCRAETHLSSAALANRPGQSQKQRHQHKSPKPWLVPRVHAHNDCAKVPQDAHCAGDNHLDNHLPWIRQRCWHNAAAGQARPAKLRMPLKTSIAKSMLPSWPRALTPYAMPPETSRAIVKRSASALGVRGLGYSRPTRVWSIRPPDGRWRTPTAIVPAVEPPHRPPPSAAAE